MLINLPCIETNIGTSPKATNKIYFLTTMLNRPSLGKDFYMISPFFSCSEMWHRQKWKAWLRWVPRHDHALQGAEAAAGGQEPGWGEDQKGRHAQQKVQISSKSSPKIIPGWTSTKPLNLNGWHSLSFCFIFMKFRMESICEKIFCAHFHHASSLF